MNVIIVTSRKDITLNTLFTNIIREILKKSLTLKFFITLGWILINSKHYVRALVRSNFNTGFEQTDSPEIK